MPSELRGFPTIDEFHTPSGVSIYIVDGGAPDRHIIITMGLQPLFDRTIWSHLDLPTAKRIFAHLVETVEAYNNVVRLTRHAGAGETEPHELRPRPTTHHRRTEPTHRQAARGLG